MRKILCLLLSCLLAGVPVLAQEMEGKSLEELARLIDDAQQAIADYYTVSYEDSQALCQLTKDAVAQYVPGEVSYSRTDWEYQREYDLLSVTARASLTLNGQQDTYFVQAGYVEEAGDFRLYYLNVGGQAMVDQAPYPQASAPTPVPQPTPESVLEFTPAPTPEPTPEPMPQPTPEPTPRPTLEPTPEPTPQPTLEPALAPTPQPDALVVPEPTAQEAAALSLPQATPDNTVAIAEVGSRGETVEQVQGYLIQLGYLQGWADGIFGENTQNAVKTVQADLGLEITGKVTQYLYEILGDMASGGEAPVSRPIADTAVIASSGSKGDTVKDIQTRLVELGFLNEAPDGLYGPNTATAVKSFEQSQGLNASGVVTASTYALLKELTRPQEIVSLFAFVNVFNGAELIAGSAESQLDMPQVPESGGQVFYDLGPYASLTLTFNGGGGVTQVQVAGQVDEFGESEAAVLNAFNAALTGCGTVNTLQQSKQFLSQLGAYGDALNAQGIGSITQGDLRYDWQGQDGSLLLTISLA